MTVPPLRPETPAAAHLDAQALASLHQLDPDGRHGVVERVLRTYESSLLTATAQVAEARERGDVKRLGEIAHKLKPSSAAVGALELSARCAAIERAAREGTLGDPAAPVEDLLAEVGRALEAVRAMLRAQPADRPR